MIQRKQTLFLLLFVLANAALLIVPCNYVVHGDRSGVSLLSLSQSEFAGSIWHSTGMILDFSAILLGLITVFMFKNRALQVRLCYMLMLLALVITLIVSFCPMVIKTDSMTAIENSGLASIAGVVSMMSGYLSAFYVKKDIELLKSADRIR